MGGKGGEAEGGSLQICNVKMLKGFKVVLLVPRLGKETCMG